MDRVKQIEQSIIKKYRKPIWRKFVKAIQTYDLIQPGDNIAVCISGGKDSMLMAKLLQEIKRHGQFDFGLVFLSMDPGYNQKNRQKIEENAKIMGIPVQFFESDIFQVVTNFEGMELIRPMYLIEEKDIIHWCRYNDLSFIQCACRFTEEMEELGEVHHTSKREEMKNLLKYLETMNPNVKKNVFKSVENVNLATIISYSDDQGKHHFLDTYDKGE